MKFLIIMGLIQAIFAHPGQTTLGSGATDQFTSIFSFETWSGVDISCPVLANGTFKKWKIKRFTAPGVGATVTYTLQKNGADTGLVITISGTDTEGEDLVNTALFAKGDIQRVIIRYTLGAPATSAAASYIEFEHTSGDNDSIYGTAATVNVLDLEATGVFNGAGNWQAGTETSSISSINGTLVETKAIVDTAPGFGNSIEVTVYKNGVKQDGTGGTVDTRCIISNINTEASAFYSLSVSPGDLLILENHYVGSGNKRMNVANRFTATSSHEFVVSGIAVNINGVNTVFYPHNSTVSAIQTTTESEQNNASGPTRFRFFNLYACIVTSPGGSTTRTVKARKNIADAGPSVTFQGSDVALTVRSDTVNVFTLQNTDVSCIQFSVTGSPATTNIIFALGGINADLSTAKPIRAKIGAQRI